MKVAIAGTGQGALHRAGRISLCAEVVAELRRNVNDDELGAVLRVRTPEGTEALMIGPDLPQRQVGSVLHVTGYWDPHAVRGLVFRAEDLQRIELPRAMQAATAYLIANISGLGRARAARLVSMLGEDALARLAQNGPDLARRVFPGGTGEQIALALAKWAEEQQRDSVAQVLTARLTTAGVGYGTVRRIVRFFSSADAAAVVALRHPYRLVEVPGVGWKTADEIAQRLGVPEDDPVRFLAACQVTLSAAVKEGHTALRPGILASRAARLLGRPAGDPKVLSAARRMEEEGLLVLTRPEWDLNTEDAIHLSALNVFFPDAYDRVRRSMAFLLNPSVQDVIGSQGDNGAARRRTFDWLLTGSESSPPGPEHQPIRDLIVRMFGDVTTSNVRLTFDATATRRIRSEAIFETYFGFESSLARMPRLEVTALVSALAALAHVGNVEEFRVEAMRPTWPGCLECRTSSRQRRSSRTMWSHFGCALHAWMRASARS